MFFVFDFFPTSFIIHLKWFFTFNRRPVIDRESKGGNLQEMNLNMNSVESVVAQIQGLSGHINDLTQLSSFLKQSEELLHTESNRLSPLLNELDPSIHSLGYLYIL